MNNLPVKPVLLCHCLTATNKQNIVFDVYISIPFLHVGELLFQVLDFLQVVIQLPFLVYPLLQKN